MSSRFHPELVNDEYGDPGLYIDFMFEKRAILFDLGDISALPARKLLRLSDIFITHRHIDHFIGFDQLLRVLLGREQTVRLYGPEGLADAVGHKLAAYSWNLVDSFRTELVFSVCELLPGDRRRFLTYRVSQAFAPSDERIEEEAGDVLLMEDSILVRHAKLDHDIVSLGFALEERAHVNIWKQKVEQLGLGVGPWLTGLKAAILANDPDDTPIEAVWKADGLQHGKTLTLGALRQAVSITPGWKIVYVTDAAASNDNARKIAGLAENASHLFIETSFMHEDEHQARRRKHMTARFAGEVAREANVDQLITMHYSPRYEGRREEMRQEAQSAFKGKS